LKDPQHRCAKRDQQYGMGYVIITLLYIRFCMKN